MSGTNLRFVLVPGKVKEKIIRRALNVRRNGLCQIGSGWIEGLVEIKRVGTEVGWGGY